MGLPYIRFIVYSVLFSWCTGEPSRSTTNFSAMSSPIMSARWLRYWKALIHTNPARFTHQRKTSSQQSLVRYQRHKGSRIRAGVNMHPSSTQRSMYDPTLLWSSLGSWGCHYGKASDTLFLEW